MEANPPTNQPSNNPDSRSYPSQSSPDQMASRQPAQNYQQPQADYYPDQDPQLPPNVRESELIPGQYVPIPEELILQWQAASRPFKKRDRQYYTTIIIIIFLISLILFFAGQFLFIAVVISIGFLSYVLAAIPPETITNQITTYGIRTDGDLYYWEELGRFWFEEKFKMPVLHIETARFPGRIALMLGDQKQEDLKTILSEVLLNQVPEPSFMDKASEWIEKNLPIDKS